METAICGRLTLSPNHVFNSKPDSSFKLNSVVALTNATQKVLSSPTNHNRSAGKKNSLCKGQCTNHGIPMAVSATGQGEGGGLLERPIIEKTTPGRESEFDFRKLRKMAPPYRVILHDDNYNKWEYVVQVLMKVIPGMTLNNAADAEDHCMQLRGNGLLSSIEPASGRC
ncbi:hypothetical protein RGQ29_000226 [Quercus rubra]|uniref:Adaptor protein ClpS core domain-containing protein n=1 Tax=Quercus rubra TaxID=3512 RepID=A0AAN7J5H7_QUERU|nr:hypothetical protein RGQ29_000226 [Quercus rubra]